MGEDKDKGNIIDDRLIAYFLTLLSVILGLNLARVFEGYKININNVTSIGSIHFQKVMPPLLSAAFSVGLIIFIIYIFIFPSRTSNRSYSTNDNIQRYILLIEYTISAIVIGILQYSITRIYDNIYDMHALL